MLLHIPHSSRPPASISKACLALQGWLENTGNRQVFIVESLDVSKQLVSFWVTGRGVPGLELALRLERLTGGAVKVLEWRQPAEGQETGSESRAPTTEQLREKIALLRRRKRHES